MPVDKGDVASNRIESCSVGGRVCIERTGLDRVVVGIGVVDEGNVADTKTRSNNCGVGRPVGSANSWSEVRPIEFACRGSKGYQQFRPLPAHL